MSETVMNLQKAIVTALARGIPDAWERIVVNYEMQEEDDGLTEDRLGFYIAKDPTGELRESDLVFSPEVKAMFREMNDEIKRTAGDRWGTCDLVVDKSGEFRFKFSYDRPKRINGVFDDDSLGRFNRYLESYKAEHA
jgi:Protein of unknown function, DUF600